MISRYEHERLTRVPDELIVEEPLEIRLDNHLVATTMRTPGEDFELAIGFCFSEGLLGDVPVTGSRYCATGSAVEGEFNVVDVETGGRAPPPTPRLGLATSSCGLCGSEAIDRLSRRWGRVVDASPFDPGVITAIARRVRSQQTLFDVTGGVHAAAAFDTGGELLAVREDIGRHNAVDKILGSLVQGGRLPAGGCGLYVSGRSSFEIVQKAWAGGFAVIVSVSAPSALAAQTARRAGIGLYGFARDGDVNLYVEQGSGGRP